MLTEFGKVFIFFLLGLVFVGLALVTARLLAPRNPTAEKLLPYECGENPFGNAWIRFNIRFYVVALIFILFDVELAVLFPWALAFQKLGMFGYVAGAIFIVILFLADFYLWAKGDLEWVRPAPIRPELKDIVEIKETRPVTPRPAAPDVATQPAS